MKDVAWAMALTALICMPLWAATASPSFSVIKQYPLDGAGNWDYLTMDSSSRRLFIARDNRVMVVDTQSGKIVKEIPGMQHAHGVALDPDLHRAYVSNGHGNNVSVVDLDTLAVMAHIAVSGKDPDAIIYDPATRQILAMNGDSNSISVIDPASDKDVSTISLSGNPEFAASDGQGNVYVNLEDKGELAHIDIRARKVLHVWPLSPCRGPTGLALDAANKRLFSVCANGWLMVTDAENGHGVAKIAIGKEPDAVTFDAQTHTIYSSSRDGVLNVIHQQDANHYIALTDVPTMKSARTQALDSVSHQVYLVGARVASRDKPISGFTLLVVGQH